MSQKRRRQDESQAAARPLKQKRVFTEQDRNRASIYEDLADEKHGTRIQAAKKLMDEFSPAHNPDAAKLSDVFNRLIRGLCSGRKAARAGYFIALTELLRQTSTSADLFSESLGNLQDLLLLINKLTKPDQNLPQETRDKLIGRVSAYKALLQASVLPGSSDNAEIWESFLDNTSKLARDTPWLREECGLMLCDFISISAKNGEKSQDAIRQIVSKYSDDGLLQTAEGVALWLTVQKAFPDLKLPKDIWHKKDPLHSTERTRLARILCDSRSSNELDSEQKKKIKSSGSWKPQPNFAWRVVMEQAFSNFSSVSKLKQFCIEVLDNSLFAEKASAERKLWGFNLLSWAINFAPADLLPAVFTPNFKRTLINQRADPKRDLFEAANSPLEAVVSRAEKDVDAALKLFETLVTSETYVHFDRVTKSNTLSKLVSNVADNGKLAMMDMVLSHVLRPQLEESNTTEEAHKARVILANLLVSMISRHTKHEGSINQTWTGKVVQSLASYAYFKSKQAEPPISDDSRSMLHDAIVRCTTHVLPKLDNPGDWLYSLAQYIQKSSKSSDHPLALKADRNVIDSIQESQKMMREVNKKLKSADVSNREFLQVFQLLFALILLEVYSGDADACDMLAELQTCYASMQTGKADAQVFDLLLELLLSFLSKTSSLYRQFADLVFPVLAKGMTEDGLESLLDILQKKETLAGQEELFESADAEDIGENGEEDYGDDISIDSDVEIMSASEDESTTNGIKDSTKGVDEETDEDGEDPELQHFNDVLAQTLRTSVPNADAADSSEEESDMDDEQMLALDPQLAKLFQERRQATGGAGGPSKKKEKSKAKLQMTLFKSRVLDLIQIYVKKRHASPVVLKVLIPLLSLMRITSSSELEKKAKTTLGTLFENCDRDKQFPTPSDANELWSLLRDIHDEVQKDASKQHDAICGRASLFVAKMLMLSDRTNIRRLIDEYGKTQVQVVENGTNVQTSFFTEWCGWCMQWKHRADRQNEKNKKEATGPIQQDKGGKKDKNKKNANARIESS
ncbi:uncharacterized protein PV09_05761 [Verruconis gallopava]|uniref:DNA polymerase V n=1 Tax=Verruconis gallopava TaxID=253628 RepID=A0A0D2A8P1_9PEZI|nr:uncharacterized protein PV09_05761 [Verruconis gallopava]KIW03118.1 hypothetical protein PV09_05761 [Verruconis gallopava]